MKQLKIAAIALTASLYAMAARDCGIESERSSRRNGGWRTNKEVLRYVGRREAVDRICGCRSRDLGRPHYRFGCGPGGAPLSGRLLRADRVC